MPKLPSEKFIATYFTCLVVAAFCLGAAAGTYYESRDLTGIVMLSVGGIGAVLFLLRLLFSQSSEDPVPRDVSDD